MPKDIRRRLEAESSSELQEDIDRYYRMYPSLGYDTKVIKTDLEDNKYVAYMSRMDSCD
jgi:uncharacterized protein (UPF0335 family)